MPHPTKIALLGALLLAAAACTRETQVRTGMPYSTQQITVGPGATIPPGTTVWLQIDQALDARNARPGQPFRAHVTQDVLDQYGQLLIPQGAAVEAHVTQVQSSPQAGQPAAIGLSFDRLVMEGVAQPIAATVVETQVPGAQPSRVRGRDVAIGAAAGAILGGVLERGKGALVGGALGAGGGALVSLGTGDVEPALPSGTEIAIRFEQPVQSLAAMRSGSGAPRAY